MKEEINEEVRQLLESLEEHGKNIRRQAQLNDLIDELAENEFGTGTSLTNVESDDLRGETTKQSNLTLNDKAGLLRSARNDGYRRRILPIWWAMGAAAACLLLWIVLKPTENQVDKTEKPVFVEQIHSADSTTEEVQEIELSREPMMAKEPVAALEPVEVRKPINNKVKPKKELQSEVSDKTVLAEAKEAEPNKNVEVEPETTLIETPTEPLDEQTPSSKRKIIKSTKLVGYEMLDKKGRPKPKRSLLEDKTLFGQSQDPNMKDGMLAYEIKF